MLLFNRIAVASLATFTLVAGDPAKPAPVIPKQPIPLQYLDDGDGNMLISITADSLREPPGSIPKERSLSFWSLNFWFLGSQWDTEKNTLLRSDIEGWLAKEIAYSPEFGLLRPSKPKGMGFPFQTSTLLLDRDSQEIQDSDIRIALTTELQRDGSSWDPSVLHVVLLPPRLVCNLGPDRSRRNFVAFLNHSTSERGTIHYLVVACSGDRQEIRKAAVRGILIHAVDQGGS